MGSGLPIIADADTGFGKKNITIILKLTIYIYIINR